MLLIPSLIKVDGFWVDGLVSLADAVVSLLLSEGIIIVSILKVLIESPNIPDLLTVADKRDVGKAEYLLGIDLRIDDGKVKCVLKLETKVFEWNTGVGLLFFHVSFGSIPADDLINLFDAVVSLLLPEDRSTLSVLTALLESTNILNLWAVENGKDGSKVECILRLEIDVLFGWSTVVGLLPFLVKVDTFWDDDLVSLSDIIISLPLSEEIVVISVLLVLLKSPNMLEVLTDDKHDVKTESLHGLDVDVFTDWSTGVALPLILMELARLWANNLVTLSDAAVPFLLLEELTTISVLLALLESPNVRDLSAAVDDKDDVKPESLLGLDRDVFTE